MLFASNFYGKRQNSVSLHDYYAMFRGQVAFFSASVDQEVKRTWSKHTNYTILKSIFNQQFTDEQGGLSDNKNRAMLFFSTSSSDEDVIQ